MVSTLIRSPRRLCRSASLHRPEGDLGDLCPAPDHDDALAEDASERPRQVDGPDVLDRFEGTDELVLRDTLDF